MVAAKFEMVLLACCGHGKVFLRFLHALRQISHHYIYGRRYMCPKIEEKLQTRQVD